MLQRYVFSANKVILLHIHNGIDHFQEILAFISNIMQHTIYAQISQVAPIMSFIALLKIQDSVKKKKKVLFSHISLIIYILELCLAFLFNC